MLCKFGVFSSMFPVVLLCDGEAHSGRVRGNGNWFRNYHKKLSRSQSRTLFDYPGVYLYFGKCLCKRGTMVRWIGPVVRPRPCDSDRWVMFPWDIFNTHTGMRKQTLHSNVAYIQIGSIPLIHTVTSPARDTHISFRHIISRHGWCDHQPHQNAPLPPPLCLHSISGHKQHS